MIVNGLDRGRVGTTTENLRSQAGLFGQPCTVAQLATVERVSSESSRLERWRGGPSGLIGVRAAVKLLKMSLVELYGPRSSAGKRAVLDAERIAEPSPED